MDREAHLNYYSSVYNRGRQLLHCKTKLSQIRQKQHAPLTKYNIKSTQKTKAWFSCLLRHPAWKWSGTILVEWEEIEKQENR